MRRERIGGLQRASPGALKEDHGIGRHRSGEAFSRRSGAREGSADIVQIAEYRPENAGSVRQGTPEVAGEGQQPFSDRTKLNPV